MEAVNTRLLVEARAVKAPSRILDIFRDLSSFSYVFSFGAKALHGHALGSTSVRAAPFFFNVFYFEEVVFCKHALGSKQALDRRFSFHTYGAKALHRYALGSYSGSLAPFYSHLGGASQHTLGKFADGYSQIHTHFGEASLHTLGKSAFGFSQIHIFRNGECSCQKHALGSLNLNSASHFFFFSKSTREVFVK